MTHNYAFSCAALSRILFDQLALPRSSTLVVAYSGGCDSTVLLYALAQVQQQQPITLQALHVNHQLQLEADNWAEQCEHFCAQLAVPLKIKRIDIGQATDSNIEAVARSARYAWFASELDEGSFLLTAHHADDQAETVLLRLMRGAGVSGLAAIPPRRRNEKHKSGPTVIRPLLGYNRHTLKKFARSNHLGWVDDPANLDLSFERNYMRHAVLPVLHQRWPAVVSLLNRSAKHARDATLLLDQLATSDIAACRGKLTPSLYCLATPLDLSSMLTLSRERTSNLMRHWITAHNLAPIPQQILEQWFSQVYRDSGGDNSIIAWQGNQLRCFSQHIYLIRLPQTNAVGQCHWNGEVIELGKLRIQLIKTNTWGIDPAVLAAGSLSWRQRRGGEVCRLPRRRHHSSLKKLFQQQQVPPWQRDHCPLLCYGDSVVWVAGIGICQVEGITTDNGGLLPVISSRLNQQVG